MVLGPWAGFGNLRDEMERLSDSLELRHWLDGRRADDGRAFPLCAAIDLVTAELTGLKPNELHVKISNGTLMIRGDKSEETQEDAANRSHRRTPLGPLSARDPDACKRGSRQN